MDLAKWRKKQAAVCHIQLRLPDALMEQILELMKQCSATLGNELQQCQADGTPHNVLSLCTDEWEAETDELIDALFLQLNNELAHELSVKHQRIKSAASGSGKSGRVEIGDVESPKGAAKKVAVNARREGLSVEANIGECPLPFIIVNLTSSRGLVYMLSGAICKKPLR